jgi:DNA-binding MarR family transcriptional regulator
MSPDREQWRGFSDIYYRMVKQARLPWATYSKLANHLIDHGFVEKKTMIVNNRKAILIRLADKGRQLVKMYVSLYGKQLEDLEPEEEAPAQPTTESSES